MTYKETLGYWLLEGKIESPAKLHLDGSQARFGRARGRPTPSGPPLHRFCSTSWKVGPGLIPFVFLPCNISFGLFSVPFL